jgi:hypothetical protein
MNGSSDDIFVLPYNEEDEVYAENQLSDLIRRKLPPPPPPPRIGSQERPYLWSYILSEKRISQNTQSNEQIEQKKRFSLVDEEEEDSSLLEENESPLQQYLSYNPNSMTIYSSSITRKHAHLLISQNSDVSQRYQNVRDAIVKLCSKKKIKTQIILEPLKKALRFIPYYTQGNLDLYSDENIRKRMSLKLDKTIGKIIQHWWNASVKIKNKPNKISKITYLSLAMAIYTVMMPDDAGKTLEDARKNSERDWRIDSRGNIYMDYPLFFDAIFELADVWCETTDREEYILFLDILFQKVYMDITLPKIMRKHVNLSYIRSLKSRLYS